MDPGADQGGAEAPAVETLLDEVRRIPPRVARQVLLFKAIGGHRFMERFRASEVEVRQAAEKAQAALCMLQLRLAVAEDLLRNTAFINRTIETYEERVQSMLAELAGPGPAANGGLDGGD